MLDELASAYSKYGKEDVILLTPTNKRANQFNQYIRTQIWNYEEAYSSGDLIMVVKNNFYWGDETPGMNFIANGEIGSITTILKEEEKYGFKFLKALLHFPNSNYKEVEAILNVHTITSESPALTFQEQNQLYLEVSKEYAHIESKSARMLKIKMDPYLNALQVKFAYAITGHKSQGGQWKAVFIDQGWLPEERINASFMRWLYTAVTRATDDVYLLNFNPKYLPQHEEMDF
jgi:exodeoxyribonuclease-5